MINFMNDIASVQHVMTPTRGTNILDLFFTSVNVRLYSVERRRERFMIVWICTKCMTYTENDRTGMHFNQPTIKKTATTSLKQIRTQSFSHTATRIYNSLPRHLKSKQALKENFNRVRVVVEFKKQLDTFLTTLPYQPTTPGLTRAAETNSIADQVNYIED